MILGVCQFVSLPVYHVASRGFAVQKLAGSIEVLFELKTLEAQGILY